MTRKCHARFCSQAAGATPSLRQRTWRHERNFFSWAGQGWRVPECIPSRLPANSETPPSTTNNIQERSNPVWFSTMEKVSTAYQTGAGFPKKPRLPGKPGDMLTWGR